MQIAVAMVVVETGCRWGRRRGWCMGGWVVVVALVARERSRIFHFRESERGRETEHHYSCLMIMKKKYCNRDSLLQLLLLCMLPWW